MNIEITPSPFTDEENGRKINQQRVNCLRVNVLCVSVLASIAGLRATCLDLDPYFPQAPGREGVEGGVWLLQGERGRGARWMCVG